MGWFTRFITSSIGQKLVMSLTGLFLIVFLIVHLAGNFQLLIDDGGKAFNEYTKMMATNPLIQTVSKGLYFFILLHAIQGIVLWWKNYQSRGSVGYKSKSTSTTTFASRNMALLGTLVFFFLIIHMGDFWYKIKFGSDVKMITYAGLEGDFKDAYSLVAMSFKNIWIVLIYVIGCLALAFHLNHGFWSAFQTLGWNHKKYTPLIKTLGRIIAWIIPIGFAIIPIWFYLLK